jgi:DNA-binding XRE family transcriptional regulator
MPQTNAPQPAFFSNLIFPANAEPATIPMRTGSKKMGSRTEAKRCSPADRRTAKIKLRPREPAPDASLPTGSQAPTELSARPLETILGLEVRRLRKSIGLTITELGAAAGISPGMISKIENGSKSPSLRTLYALAKAVNVPLARLFAETDERRDCS